jgi:hypothetical protein
MSNSEYVGRRGRARMKELAAQDAIIIEGNTERLLAELGQSPSQACRLQAEMFCSLMQRASRLRRNGCSDLEVLREAAALLHDLPWLRATQGS